MEGGKKGERKRGEGKGGEGKGEGRWEGRGRKEKKEKGSMRKRRKGIGRGGQDHRIIDAKNLAPLPVLHLGASKIRTVLQKECSSPRTSEARGYVARTMASWPSGQLRCDHAVCKWKSTFLLQYPRTVAHTSIISMYTKPLLILQATKEILTSLF